MNRDSAITVREMIVVDRFAETEEVIDGVGVSVVTTIPSMYGLESKGQFTVLPLQWQPASDPESSWR